MSYQIHNYRPKIENLSSTKLSKSSESRTQRDDVELRCYDEIWQVTMERTAQSLLALRFLGVPVGLLCFFRCEALLGGPL